MMMPANVLDPAGLPPGYEFSAAENALIDKTGGRARAWGTSSIVIAGLIMLFAVYASTRGLLGVALAIPLAGFSIPYLVAGKFYLDAATSLRAVVETEGNDIPLMLSAVGKLRDAVRIEAVATIIAFCVGLVLGAVLISMARHGM